MLDECNLTTNNVMIIIKTNTANIEKQISRMHCISKQYCAKYKVMLIITVIPKTKFDFCPFYFESMLHSEIINPRKIKICRTYCTKTTIIIHVPSTIKYKATLIITCDCYFIFSCLLQGEPCLPKVQKRSVSHL